MPEFIKVAALPCRASELEDALHKACDHGGMWNGEIQYGTENGTMWLFLIPAPMVGGMKRNGGAL